MSSPQDEKLTSAFRKYIAEIRASIEPGSGLAGIEAAMKKHENPMMLSILEEMTLEEGDFPPREAETQRVSKKRKTAKSDPKPLG